MISSSPTRAAAVAAAWHRFQTRLNLPTGWAGRSRKISMSSAHLSALFRWSTFCALQLEPCSVLHGHTYALLHAGRLRILAHRHTSSHLASHTATQHHPASLTCSRVTPRLIAPHRTSHITPHHDTSHLAARSSVLTPCHSAHFPPPHTLLPLTAHLSFHRTPPAWLPLVDTLAATARRPTSCSSWWTPRRTCRWRATSGL